MEHSFSEIMQYKVEKRIHFELIPTSTSRDEIGKLSWTYHINRKTDLGLLEIKFQLLTPRKNLTSVELYSHCITGIIKGCIDVFSQS